MKNGTLLFLGLFGVFTCSWAAFVLGPNAQLGRLTPYYDAATDKALPGAPSGLAARGEMVYRDLGCVACHTQQVRRAGLGADIDRKWGVRQSWSRDFLFRERAHLGQNRVGPDLANVGARQASADDLYRLLRDGTDAMPAYPFLFEQREGGAIVPTPRAQVLVAYLMSLNAPESYPPEKANNEVKDAAHGSAESKEGAH